MATREDSETGYRLSPAPLVIEENHDEFRDDPAPAFASGGFDVDSFTHDHLHCPSCGKYYDDPRTLPCLHSYCRECLEKEAREQKEKREREREREAREQREEREMEAREKEGNGQIEEEPQDLDESYLETLRSSYNLTLSSTGGLTNEHSEPLSDSFYCPQASCQCPTGIKFDRDGDIDHIPPSNKFLANMVKGVQLKNELPAGKVLCGDCNDDTAMAICNDPECANLPLCSDCLRHHKKAIKTKRHNIVHPETIGAIGDSNGSRDGEEGSPPPSWKDFERRNWLCDIHPNYLVDRYCYKHEQVICPDCSILGGDDDDNGHRGCGRVEKLTEEYVDRERIAANEVLDEVKGVHASIIKAINEIESMKRSLTNNRNWAISAINERCDELIVDLERQRESLTNQTEQIHNEEKANLEKHQNVLKCISDTLQESIDFIGGSVNMAIPTEFMFLKESFHERLKYLERYKYSNRIPSDVNDKIHLKLNDGFSMEGALGQVVGTPFIENYTLLEPKPRVVHARRCYSFQVQSRDICKTPVAGSVPILKATICLVGLEPTDCNVKLKDEEGVYTITFKAERAGKHEIRVFFPQTHPVPDLLVKGCPFYIDVRQ